MKTFNIAPMPDRAGLNRASAAALVALGAGIAVSSCVPWGMIGVPALAYSELKKVTVVDSTTKQPVPGICLEAKYWPGGLSADAVSKSVAVMTASDGTATLEATSVSAIDEANLKLVISDIDGSQNGSYPGATLAWSESAEETVEITPAP